MKPLGHAATVALVLCLTGGGIEGAATATESAAVDRGQALRGSFGADAPRVNLVDVLLPKDAKELERFAAAELRRYLDRLFGVSANVVSEPSASADACFLLSGSESSASQWLDAGDRPKLSDQGFLLRKTTREGKPAMLIVGGSPRAMLWGVYELVERYGVTYLLSGDVLPERQLPFTMPELDRVFEPTFKMRWFKTMGDFAMGMEGWGMADYRPFLDQLAKLKFNRIRIGGCGVGPFLDLQLKGVKRQSAVLWYGEHYPITPDMPGRKLFGNEAEFWNPDLLTPQASYKDMLAAGQRHQHALIAYAHSRGIEASHVGSILDFPKDLSAAIPDPHPVEQLGKLTVAPGPKVRPDSPEIVEIGGAVLRAILDQHPDADSYGFPVGTEFPAWLELYQWAWQELDRQYGVEAVLPLAEALRRAERRGESSGRGAERTVRDVKGHITGLYYLLRLWNDPEIVAKSRRPDARLVVYEVAEELWPILPRILPKNTELAVCVDYTSTRVLRRRDVLATVPAKDIPTTMVLALHDDNVGMLPMLTTCALDQLVGDMRKSGIQGFCTRQWLTSDHDASTNYLAKAAWDASATPEKVYRDQVRAVCGEAAVAPMLEAFREIEAVTTRLEDHGMGLTFPVPAMMMGQWFPEPLQAPYVEDRAIYKRALDAVRKTPLPSRPEGKAYVQYWRGRIEFAVCYFDAMEAVRKAAIAEKAAAEAKQKGDTAAHRAKLAETLEHATAAHAAAVQSLEAFAAVAKNRADAGAVATMAEYVYRPLKAKLESLRKESEL